MSKPVAPFVDIRVTEPGLHTDGKSPCFSRLYDVGGHFRTANQTASFPFWRYIRCWTAHIDIHTAKALFSHIDTHLPEIFGLISPYMSDNGLFIVRKRQAPAHTVSSLWMTIAFRVCKLCEKHIGSCRCTDDMTKHDMSSVQRQDPMCFSQSLQTRKAIEKH